MGKNTVELQFRFKSHLCSKVGGNLLMADRRWDCVVALKASRTLHWAKPFWGQFSAEPYAVIFSRARWYMTLSYRRKTVSIHITGMRSSLWDTRQRRISLQVIPLPYSLSICVFVGDFTFFDLTRSYTYASSAQISANVRYCSSGSPVCVLSSQVHGVLAQEGWHLFLYRSKDELSWKVWKHAVVLLPSCAPLSDSVTLLSHCRMKCLSFSSAEGFAGNQQLRGWETQVVQHFAVGAEDCLAVSQWNRNTDNSVFTAAELFAWIGL